MHSHVIRGRLVFPVAAVLTLSLVSVPHTPGSAMTVPRLTEVSAVRLQAEVTSLVTGMAGAEPPAAAASALTGTGSGATAAASCTYPCTVLDKFLWNLPVDIRNALLPPLYAVAWVVGLVMAPVVLLTSALFGWPYSLRPAAPVTPETSPAPAEATPAERDPIRSQADPVLSSSVPGQTANASEAAVEIASGSDDHRPRVRGHRSAGAQTDPLESSVSPEASVSAVPAVPAVPATEAATLPTPSADLLTAAITAAEDAAPVEHQPSRARGRSVEAAPSDSAPSPQRAVKRSAR